jgi:hypothetical protein
MPDIQWTVTEASGEVKTTSDRKKLAYRQAFEITEKTPKGQAAGASSFNEMRQRLLDLGEMESK